MTLQLSLRNLLVVMCCIGIPANVQSQTIRQQARSVQPSFEISPLVQRISGRPGQRVEFQFKIATRDFAADLELLPVALVQQENGIILPDPHASAVEGMRLKTPDKLSLVTGSSEVIRGEITIPNDPSPLHYFGLLVRDQGRALDNPSEKSAVHRIGLRFVTQFLLRIEVSVPGARAIKTEQIVIESADIHSHEGRPRIEVFVSNEQKGGTEFEALCLIFPRDRPQHVRRIRLTLPSKEHQAEETRYQSRILGNSRVKLVANVPYYLASGEYELKIQLAQRGRVLQQESSCFAVSAGDFPAQRTDAAELRNGVIVSPAHIELSRAAHGDRMVALKLENRSLDPVELNLTSTLDASQLRIQPEKVLLHPRQQRNILVSLGRTRDNADPLYGQIKIEIQQKNAETATSRIPVALLEVVPTPPKLKIEKTEWKRNVEQDELEVTLVNSGSVHATLEGTLLVQDPFQRKLTVQGGYGEWIMPGENKTISFPLKQQLAPGVHDVALTFKLAGQSDLQMSGKLNVK